MVFIVKIRTDSAAFEDDPREELSRLLRKIADKVEQSGNELGWFQTILDANGNDVGRFALKNEEQS